MRQQGFAIDREEFHQGMVAIAVPVKDPSGAFFAALAIHGPIQRFNEADAVSRFDLLNSAAQNIHNILFDNSRTSKHEG